jgi:hypothetical protein
MEPSAPAVGARVMPSGLQARSDLNGKYGVVTGLDMTRLRAGVKIEGSGEQNQEQEQEQEQVMCKFSNLTVGGGCRWWRWWWCQGQGQDDGQKHRCRRGRGGAGGGAGPRRWSCATLRTCVPGLSARPRRAASSALGVSWCGTVKPSASVWTGRITRPSARRRRSGLRRRRPAWLWSRAACKADCHW